MLCADLMVGAGNSTLEKAPDVLNAVRMGIPTYVLLNAVVNRLMACVVICKAVIRSPVIGIDNFSIRRDMLLNEGIQRFTVTAFYNLKANLTAAFYNANDDGFIAFVATPFAFNFSANPSLINFNATSKRRLRNFAHGGADSMAEIPCCFVRHAERALNLISRYAFPGFRHHVNGQKPFPQRKMTIMEDRTGSYRELIAA